LATQQPREPQQSQQPRSNEQWIQDLSQPGPEQERALADLRNVLVRGLGYALSKYANVKDADLEDFAQDALLKILAGIASFRGESQFTTWAQKIAVHTAFTELRRRRWRDVSLEEVTAPPDTEDTASYFIPNTLADPAAGTEQQTIQNEIIEIMRRVINEELSDKQRQALIAVRFRGMPMAEVARQMGTNTNALYKLLFDARKRLKQRMLARGLSSEDILGAFEL
jgi:RNA polymerase sigma-70 factor (ECF subfamily)